MKRRWLRRIFFGICAVVLGTFVLGAVVMLLWNAVMPPLFGLTGITFWQAVGLFLLAHILLRGWGPWRHGWRHDHWRRRMEEKLAAMTPEEREKFKSEWRHRCGRTSGTDEPEAAPQAG
jgi:hypothetical protein